VHTQHIDNNDRGKLKILVLGLLKYYIKFHGSLKTGSGVQMGVTEAAL
jgi:hypothetical protein